MFELLTPTPAKLVNVNVRSELKGKEATPAVDLKLSFDAANSVLSLFDGALLSALYHKAGPVDVGNGQAPIEGVEEISDVPNLRMPMLAAPLRWSREYTGYEIAFDFGLGGKSNITLTDCGVNNVAFEPKEGGTVTTTVRVQCSKGLTEKVLGKLATLVQHDVSITLRAPEVQSGALLDADKGDDWPFPKGGATTPEEAFAGA